MEKIIGIILGFVLLLAALVLFVSWRRPLRVRAWLNRLALGKAGLAKTRVSTALGTQTLWVGGSGPTLILLHGAGDQAGTWAKIAPELRKHYRLIIPDLPGHGESTPRGGPLSVETILGGVTELAAREPGRVTLVGNSLGAWVAMLYARQYPEKIERLVLINGGALAGNRFDLTLTPSNRIEARKLFESILDPGSPKVPDFVLDDVIRQARDGPVPRLMQNASEIPAFLLDGRLNEVTVPVDLIWGESDQLFSLDYARRMQLQLAAVRLTTIPRCGHVPQQECPSALTRALLSVLASPAPASSGRQMEAGQ